VNLPPKVNCEDDLWRHYNIAGELNEFLTEDNSTCLIPPEPGVSLPPTHPPPLPPTNLHRSTPRTYAHEETMQC